MRGVVAGLLVAGLLVVAVPVAAAEPVQPPKLDVAAATVMLDSQQIYRAPGAVAWFDEELVRAELTPDIRILVAPPTGRYEKGNNYADGDAHFEQVYEPLRDWAEAAGVTLIRIEGLHVTSTEGYAARPSTVAELRQTHAYDDVTDLVVSLIRSAKGLSDDEAFDTGHQPDDVVQPTERQLGELAGALASNPVYNAPGRTDDPIVDGLAEHVSTELGLSVRVAAFPTLRRGDPLIDYAPALSERFPDDVVLVSYGSWLDVAAADQQKLASARDFAYGRYQGSVAQGLVMTDRMSTVLERFHELSEGTAFGRPLPEPFDLAARIGKLTPWLLLGSAIVLAAGSLLPWWLRRLRRSRDRAAQLRLAGARTLGDVTTLGAELVAAEQDTVADLSAAWERHATARDLYEQAHTPEAMAEVREICAQGTKTLQDVRGGR